MNSLAETDAAIRQLHARYVDAVFRQDFDAFADCFTEDAEWRISGMVFAGRTEIKTAISSIMARATRVYMSFSTPLIGEDALGLSARTYVNERCVWKDGKTNISIGRYYERFAVDGAQLRFAWRVFELHYSGPPDLSGEWKTHPDYGPPPAMPPQDSLPGDHASAKWGLSMQK